MAEWGVVVVTVGKPKVQHSQVTSQYFYVTERLAFRRHWLKHSKNILCNIKMIKLEQKKHPEDLVSQNINTLEPLF